MRKLKCSFLYLEHLHLEHLLRTGDVGFASRDFVLHLEILLRTRVSSPIFVARVYSCLIRFNSILNMSNLVCWTSSRCVALHEDSTFSGRSLAGIHSGYDGAFSAAQPAELPPRLDDVGMMCECH